MIKPSIEYDSSIFDQLSNRELELIWNILKPSVNLPFIKNPQFYYYQKNILLPPITKIKIDLINLFNKSSQRNLMAGVINLLIINRIIDLDRLSWIDQENQQQINFILSRIKPQYIPINLKSYQSEMYITIPYHKDYRDTYKYFIKYNYPIFISRTNESNENNKNQTFPIYNHVFPATPPTPIPEKNSNNEFENLIYYIDLIVLNIESKISFMETIRYEWELHITQHNIHYDWIDPSDHNQIDWCIKYLEKKEKYYPYFSINKNNTSKYFELLILLDNIQPYKLNYDYLKSIKFYETMKKSWGQQKYRSSGKLRKPYHLPLTKVAQTQLEKLAGLKNTKKENVIEELIAQEYSKFTDSNGNFKYQ